MTNRVVRAISTMKSMLFRGNNIGVDNDLPQIEHALKNYNRALKRHIPLSNYDEVFFCVIGCQPDDSESLRRTDLSRFTRGIHIINGLTLALSEMQQGGMDGSLKIPGLGKT